MTDSHEYKYISFMVIFTGILLFLLSLIGYSNYNQDFQTEPTEGFNPITGLKLYYTNPLTSGIEKVFFTLLIITPFIVFTSMYLLNLARGR